MPTSVFPEITRKQPFLPSPLLGGGGQRIERSMKRKKGPGSGQAEAEAEVGVAGGGGAGPMPRALCQAIQRPGSQTGGLTGSGLRAGNREPPAAPSRTEQSRPRAAGSQGRHVNTWPFEWHAHSGRRLRPHVAYPHFTAIREDDSQTQPLTCHQEVPLEGDQIPMLRQQENETPNPAPKQSPKAAMVACPCDLRTAEAEAGGP